MPKSSNDDNIAAAMDHVMENEELTINLDTGSEPGKPAAAQVLIRTTEEERELWKRAAEMEGCSLSEFGRRLLSEASRDLLFCSHPMEMRKIYPWSEFCLQCGQRIL